MWHTFKIVKQVWDIFGNFQILCLGYFLTDSLLSNATIPPSWKFDDDDACDIDISHKRPRCPLPFVTLPKLLPSFYDTWYYCLHTYHMATHILHTQSPFYSLHSGIHICSFLAKVQSGWCFCTLHSFLHLLTYTH